MLREPQQQVPERDLHRALDIPARDTLVAAAIRQMARDLRAYEARHAGDVGELVDRTTRDLRGRLGRAPTPAEVARTGGLDVEDVLDVRSRRRRGGRFPRP
jgi:hypothetical protein